MHINYFITYPENFDIQLKKIIENLDAESFDNYIRDGGDKRGIPFDEKCLLYCYTFRCPKTAEILLSNGIDSNIDCGVSASLLAYIDDGRRWIGFNYSSEILIEELEEIIMDYGGLEFNFDE